MTGMYKSYLLIIGLLCFLNVDAQLPFGHEQAVYKDSSIIISWAASCTLQKGYADISMPSSGFPTVGDETSALGKAMENGTVSLGDGGSAVLTFPSPVVNGAGYDFAVFENGFQTSADSLFFLELAFVEVSSDGVNFFRFKSSSKTDNTIQIGNGDGMNPKLIQNLAGKYVTGFGTPFDLEELKNTPGLDVNYITHIKVIDVVGSIENNYARRDSAGNKINDPWPTPFPSSGFDLDAVGIIHQKYQTGMPDENEISDQVKIYPLPNNRSSELHVAFGVDNLFSSCELSDLTGSTVAMQPCMDKNLTIDVSHLAKGIYCLKLSGDTISVIRKIIIE